MKILPLASPQVVSSYLGRMVPLALPLVLLAGCPASGDEVRPPAAEFYFPTGLAVTPDDSALLVANANSDLRYDSGTAQLVSLDEVDEIVSAWLATGVAPTDRDCTIDASVPYTLICDETEVVREDATVRIGNFASDVTWQALESGGFRGFATVRGDPSITWFDYDGDTLSCGEGGDFPECDEDHRLNQLRGNEDLTGLPSEPFSVYIDSTNGYGVVTHLRSGAVTLLDTPANGDAPVLADALGNLFAPSAQTGLGGSAGAAGRLPGADNDRIYVTSTTEARVQTLRVDRTGAYPVLVPAEFFFINQVLPSNDSRDIAFTEDGSRAFILNRNPPMLQVIDTSIDERGVPRNEFLSAIEVCRQASTIQVLDTGRGDRVYVGCFGSGQVWSIDPRSGGVEAIIDVGRGPQSVVAAPTRNQLYVSNFLEDTVAVIDLTPGTATENRVVLRLGFPRTGGGE